MKLKLRKPRKKHRVSYRSPLGAKIKLVPSGCSNVGGMCWEWIGALNEKGYPRLRYKGRQERAHRVVWIVCRGWDAIAGNELHHKCRNRKCVNPRHMKPHSDHRKHMEEEHGWRPAA